MANGSHGLRTTLTIRTMAWDPSELNLSIPEQVKINQARTPTERFLAMCDLLDYMCAKEALDPEFAEQQRALRATRAREKEEMRAYFRQIIAERRAKGLDEFGLPGEIIDGT